MDNQMSASADLERRRLVILGSTGSIGTQALEVVDEYPERLSVVALAAGHNAKLLEAQVRKYRPRYAVLWEEAAAQSLRDALADVGDVKVLAGMEGLLEIAQLPDYDILLAAIVGMIGIRPTIAAIRAGKAIALANKETLVCAGHIIMPLAREAGVPILPVDSEHSAIFQSMNGELKGRVAKLWLTCSGGPFRGYTREQLGGVSVEDALRHPNWSMGRKITIDSATMVNKGLEVMEARWLFDVDYDDINVVVHPQSIVHSMVEYQDGAVIAQLGAPDMKLPIQYAFFYPDRLALRIPRKRADFYALGHLDFEEPDLKVFRGIPLALQAGREAGTMPTVYNAANERAVALFLAGKIPFLRIEELIERAMDAHRPYRLERPGVEDILAAEQWTYEYLYSRNYSEPTPGFATQI